ncbi:MAG: GNAT family N-acetyltransferase [Pseudomonadota bacterium]
MHIRLLRQQDAEQLLQFEIANRDWFEEFIETRAAQFYTDAGIQAHIADFLAQYAAGRLYPCLMLDEAGVIIGRANLRNIERDVEQDMGRRSRTAHVGYRVARHCAGRGVASAAVAGLLELGRTHLHLAQMIAHVSVENFASIRVLEKSGFTRIGMRDTQSLVQGRALDCHEYAYVFPAA